MKLLFLHPVFTAESLAVQNVSSHAANVWCRNLFTALVAKGVDLWVAGHFPERIWPFGRIFPRAGTEAFSGKFLQAEVRYVNFPFARTFSLSVGYRRVLRRLLPKIGRGVVCTYNPLPWECAAAVSAVTSGYTWISFVLDDDTVLEHGWKQYLKKTELAKGHVFVSKWAFDHAPIAQKFFFEGGVVQWRGEKNCGLSKTPSFLFCGQIGDATEASVFTRLLEVAPKLDFEVWISGRGQERLSALAAQDSRLKLLGYLSEEDLDRRIHSAWGLLNLRSPEHRGACMNFPSKLFLYLSYGKPIISVFTPGIPEHYRDVIQFTDASPESIVSEIERIMKLSGVVRDDLYEKTYHFVMTRCLLDDKVDGLISFMDSLQ